MLPLKHAVVVVPVDFSDRSVEAIRAGLDRVHDPDGLHVLHVLVPLDRLSSGVLTWAGGESREDATRRELEALIERAGAKGARAVVLSGDPGLTTAEYAKSADARLIVMPSHGRHGLERLLLGSTAERVVRHAPCSVLVLRQPAG
jgi:nucleotide-binding universal stress UspA family protein